MIQYIPKEQQASGSFNNGEIIENKPIGFPREGGKVKPYSNLFYWAYAEAKTDSTIGLHPHRGFEIMSFVLNGSIKHYDTKLEEWRPLQAGDAQVIRAGNGISHSEFMAKDGVMFQIWFDPNLEQTMQQAASYSDYTSDQFPITTNKHWTIKTFVGTDSPFELDTKDVKIEEIKFESSNQSIAIDTTKIYSIYILEGNPIINGQVTSKDGFLLISNAEKLTIESEGAGKIFLIESPATVEYPTYQQLMQQQLRQQ